MDPDNRSLHCQPRHRVPWLGLGVCGGGLAALTCSLIWHFAPPMSGATSPAGLPAAATSALASRPEDRFTDIPPITTPVSAPLRVVADRGRSAGERLRPLVDGNLARIRASQDVALMRRILRDPGEDDTLRNEAANLLQRSDVPELATDLIRVLDQDGERARFRSFAVQHLGMLWARQGAVREGPSYRRLMACLEDRHVDVQREALLALARGDAPGIAARVAAILHEVKHEALIDLGCRLAADLDLHESLPAVRALVDHADPVIARAAADATRRLAASAGSGRGPPARPQQVTNGM